MHLDLELPQLRVEDVAQPVAEEVEGEHHEHNGKAWKDRDPPGAVEHVPTLGDQVPPRGFRRGNSGAKEAEGGLHLNGPADLQGSQYHDAVEDVGKEVLHDN